MYSTTDYVVISRILLPGIVNFTVHEYDGLLSNVHCPISLTLHLDYENKDKPEEVKNIANKPFNIFTDRQDMKFKCQESFIRS